MTRRRAWSTLAAVLLGLSAASACGGRYTDAQRLAAEGTLLSAEPSGPSNRATANPTAGAASGTQEPVTTGQTNPAASPAVTATASPAPATPTPTNRATAASPGAAGSGRPIPAAGRAAPSSGGVGRPPAPSGPPPSAPAARTAAPGAKAPIKLASIGVRSGVLGSVFIPFYEGAVAWVNDVNRRGGLAGHPVQLIAVDDGDDPRRAVAAAKRLVEDDKVTAFYAEHQVSTFDAIIPYLEEKGMPVIGSSIPNVGHENTPIFFNLAFSARSGLMWNHLLPIFLFQPEVKDIGVLYCGEAELCKVLNSELNSIAPRHGYRIRYSAQVSVAQPDFTAEVLAARNAGAKALVLFMDNYSAIRIATSAHRQGYDPFFGIQGSAHSEKFLRDGGKEVEGFLIGGIGLHWTTPLLADFTAAFRASVPNGNGLSSFAIASWNSGKLLEKVAPTWPDTPTPADVIASLRALRGETLGGLVPPATFRPGEKAGTQCSTILRIENGGFVPFQGRNEYHCAPGYQGR